MRRGIQTPLRGYDVCFVLLSMVKFFFLYFIFVCLGYGLFGNKESRQEGIWKRACAGQDASKSATHFVSRRGSLELEKDNLHSIQCHPLPQM